MTRSQKDIVNKLKDALTHDTFETLELPNGKVKVFMTLCMATRKHNIFEVGKLGAIRVIRQEWKW